jgi:hypothetical protein
MPATTWGHVSQPGRSATKLSASPCVWTIGKQLRSRSNALRFLIVAHLRHGSGPRHAEVHALMLVTIMQAVISASFSVAKLRSGAQSDADGKKRRDQRRELTQPAPPQSLAPWHTLPYMGREVRGCNNPSHGAYVSEFCFPSLHASRSVQVHYLAGVLRQKVSSRVVRARRRCGSAALPHQSAAGPAT